MWMLIRHILGSFVCGAILVVSMATVGYASNIEAIKRMTAIDERLGENINKFLQIEEETVLLYKTLGSFAANPYNVYIKPIERESRARGFRVYEVLGNHLVYLKKRKNSCDSPFLQLSLIYSKEILEIVPSLVLRLESLQKRFDPKTEKLIPRVIKLLFTQEEILNELMVEAKTCLK